MKYLYVITTDGDLIELPKYLYNHLVRLRIKGETTYDLNGFIIDLKKSYDQQGDPCKLRNNHFLKYGTYNMANK